MSRLPGDQSERLLSSDATAFERRVLEAAMKKQPSAAASARMARALGVSVVAVGTSASASTLAAGAAASNVTAAAGTAGTVVWPWISAGVIGLVIAGAVVGTRVGHRDRASHAEAQRPAAPAMLAAPAREGSAPIERATVVEPPARAVTPSPRARVTTAAGDLGDQVAFVDAARAAVSSGASRHALEILRRYQDKYPAGSFRPEAAAIKVEALMKLGREADARALAERFVAEHRGTLLARRVADLAGLTTAP